MQSLKQEVQSTHVLAQPVQLLTRSQPAHPQSWKRKQRRSTATTITATRSTILDVALFLTNS